MDTKAVLIVTVLCMSVNAIAQDKNSFPSTKDSIVTLNDNSLTIAYYSDTIVAVDPITTEVKRVIYNENMGPVKLNGEKIYSPYNDSELQHYTKLRKGNKYLVEHLQLKTNRYYERLEKAGYNADFRNIVVNTNGKIIYYEYSGMYKVDTSNQLILSKRVVNHIDKKAKKILNKVQLMPATVNNTTVAYRVKHYELL